LETKEKKKEKKKQEKEEKKEEKTIHIKSNNRKGGEKSSTSCV